MPDVIADTLTPEREAIASELAEHQHGRVPGELRRRQLLMLAGDLFAERGFKAASMDELASRAGISKPVIYGQFGSKEGLLVELVDDLGRGLNVAVAAAVAGRTQPEDLLRAGSLAFFGFIGARHATWAMIYGASRSITESVASPATDKIEEIRRRQDSLVAAVILAVAKQGGSEPEPLELGAMTRALNGVYEGLVEWWREHPETTPEQLTEWVIALVLPGLERLAAG